MRRGGPKALGAWTIYHTTCFFEMKNLVVQQKNVELTGSANDKGFNEKGGSIAGVYFVFPPKKLRSF